MGRGGGGRCLGRREVSLSWEAGAVISGSREGVATLGVVRERKLGCLIA